MVDRRLRIWESLLLEKLARILEGRRDALTLRLVAHDAALREDFDALDALDFSPSYDECVEILKKTID
jgi:hypothetical protein